MAPLHARSDSTNPLSLSEISHVERSGTVSDVFVHGARIRWRSFGAGPPLVLLHGGHGSWMHWARNVLALASEHRVLVPDLPGFFDSDDLPNTSSSDVRGMVSALRACLIDLIGGSTVFDLAGFSFGALVAAELAAGQPEVRRLALLGPAGHGTPRRQGQPLANWRAEVDPDARRLALRQNLATFMFYCPEAIDHLALAIHELSCIRTRFRSKELSRAGGLIDALGKIDKSVLLVWGTDDVTAHPTETAEFLRQDQDNREWCLISNAGHWVQYERADDVNALLLSWFKPDKDEQPTPERLARRKQLR
jgi:2-hydroxy-6-oxonona-2,4-dienedioate hydrolase